MADLLGFELWELKKRHTSRPTCMLLSTLSTVGVRAQQVVEFLSTETLQEIQLPKTNMVNLAI